jgi:hypothetical protein
MEAFEQIGLNDIGNIFLIAAMRANQQGKGLLHTLYKFLHIISFIPD